MTTRKQSRQRTFDALALTSAIALSVCLYLAATPAVTPPGTGHHSFAMATKVVDDSVTVFGFLSFLLAALSFASGVLVIWLSRQPQNREDGYLVRGVAFLVLGGMLVLSGVWTIHPCCTVCAPATTADVSSTSIMTFQ